MSDTAQKKPIGGEKKQKVILVVCAALVLIGLIGYVLQLTLGLSGYAAHAPWGLYIVAFYCAAGLGAGALIAAATIALSRSIDDSTLSKLYAVAAAAFVVASACVIADLGSPAALFEMIISPNLAGPLFYDMIILAAGIVVGIVGAVMMRRADAKRTPLAVASLAIAIAVLAIEAWLLSITYAHDSWSLLLGFTPALIQAAVLGIAALALLAPDVRALRYLLGFGAAVVVLTEGVEAAIGIKDTLAGAQLAAFIQSPLLWIAAVIAVAGIVLLCQGKGRWAAAATLAEVVFIKAAAIWSGQAIAVTSKDTFLGGFGIGFEEVLVIAGIAAVGVLVYQGIGIILDKRTGAAEPSAAQAQSSKAVTA